MDNIVGVDGRDEFVIYIAPVGKTKWALTIFFVSYPKETTEPVHAAHGEDAAANDLHYTRNKLARIFHEEFILVLKTKKKRPTIRRLY